MVSDTIIVLKPNFSLNNILARDDTLVKVNCNQDDGTSACVNTELYESLAATANEEDHVYASTTTGNDRLTTDSHVYATVLDINPSAKNQPQILK